jgi:hypothetical protein
MGYVKPPLSAEENQVLQELLQVSGGMCCKKPISCLNYNQTAVMRALKEKGYVMATKRNFWVILPP